METKRKVFEVVTECLLELNELSTTKNLNIFLLGLYDILISMDWLEQLCGKVDYYNKTIECVDGKGMPTKVRGILQQIVVTQISSL